MPASAQAGPQLRQHNIGGSNGVVELLNVLVIFSAAVCTQAGGDATAKAKVSDVKASARRPTTTIIAAASAGVSEVRERRCCTIFL